MSWFEMLVLFGLVAFHYFYLNQFITTVSVSVTGLRQCRCHGWTQRRECGSGSSTTSARLVSRVGVYYCFPTLLGNISIFQHRPVQRGTWQKEPEEAQLNGAKINDVHHWLVAVLVSVTPWSVSALYVREGFFLKCKKHECWSALLNQPKEN